VEFVGPACDLVIRIEKKKKRRKERDPYYSGERPGGTGRRGKQ